MILKIYTDEQSVGTDELDMGYILMDGIAHIHLVRKNISRKELEEEINKSKIITSSNKGEPNQCWIICTMMMKDDSIHKIAFDTIAYICNDNGKTIEKIFGNHCKIPSKRDREESAVESAVYKYMASQEYKNKKSK